MVRPKRRARRAADVLTEATSLSVGDLVVHADHGIGRFAGLTTITALGAPHDCLELKYAGGDTLYLPVENIELLARYGSDEGDAQLDRLGGIGWQSRKARLKKRLREIAAELIKVAALRQLREAPAIAPPAGAFDEFVARFPYEETEDQEASIEAVLADLNSGKPMDRLVCGDVGFGKTEVALRATFVAAMNGLQVAVVVPTTLLARQHSKTFRERFSNLPLRIGQASRLVAAKELAEVKDGLKKGTIDIVVGTHALLGKQIEFARLGLLIIDEEQHFGVGSQGAPEAAARGRARADAVGDADPAHLAARADGRARAVAHRDAAGRSSRGAHLHLAVRSRHSRRRAQARARSAAGRPSTSRRASPTSTTSPSSCARRCRT